MNFIILYFSFISTNVIIWGTLMNMLGDKLPAFFLKTFRYGKFKYKGNLTGIPAKLIIEIPKSTFKQFYEASLVIATYVFYQTTAIYIFNREVPNWLTNLMYVTCGEDRVAHTPAIRVYIALSLLTLQIYRRFYDTHYISVFGKHSYMNLFHYILGMLHYPGAILAIISEAPIYTVNSSYGSTNMDLSMISYQDIFAILLFIWAWWHQHVTTKILANLRKNMKGTVVSNEHKLPHGDWFEYLSAPHQTAEILMYTSLTILLCYNITWFFVFTWVVTNQVQTIMLSHWWYKETFSDFPKNRKALIPFVY